MSRGPGGGIFIFESGWVVPSHPMAHLAAALASGPAPHAEGDANDWIRDNPQFRDGTTVWMRLPNQTTRTTKKIFDEYVSGEDYDFSRTVVPVVLAQHLGEPLLSRSQAKRVLARVELFRTVVFDFSRIEAIGQAFADEIFRVFAQSHPQIDLQFIHAKADIAKMIDRARSQSGRSLTRAAKKGM